MLKDKVNKLNRAIFLKESFNQEKNRLLAELGFRETEKIWKILIRISEQLDFNKLFPGFFPALMRLFFLSFDQDRAAINFERFSQKIFDKNYFYTLLSLHNWLTECLITIFSGSQFITDILLREPHLFDWISNYEVLHQSPSRDDLARECALILKKRKNFPEFLEGLRKFKKREFLRIGIRDLMHKVELEEVMLELSNLADICLQFAYDFSLKELIRKHGVSYYPDNLGEKKRTEFSVLALGKLGGRELNFSSDIDLLFLYTSDQGRTTGGEEGIPLSNHEYFCKLSRLISRAIGEVTAEGNVFRVDLDLRPEGKSGDIANSLRSFEIYYESWGQSWEKQSLLKARLAAGSERLGKEFFSMIESFLYRKYLDFSSLEEIRKMKEKINLKYLKNKTLNLKLGYGGIREIEFIIQLFQLIYGARDKKIREKNSLQALKKLLEQGYLGETDYKLLSSAYCFLRELEHRIQIMFGLQVHNFPEKIESRASLGRKMGIKGKNIQEITHNLLGEYDSHTRNVRRIYETLFIRDASPKEIRKEAKDICDLREIDQFIGFDSLKGYNFRNPERVYKNLQLLYEGLPFSHPTLKSKRLFSALTLPLLQFTATLPDPDLAINNLERFVKSSGSREMFYSLLLEKEKFREVLLILFANSEYFSNILIRNPYLLDILSEENFSRFKTKETWTEELAEFLVLAEDYGDKLAALRRFKKGEELCICLRFLSKNMGLFSTFTDLSNLAVVCLRKGLEIAQGSAEKIEGFSIIGMGKLGGGELDFGSDLDLIFVTEERNQLNQQFHFTRLCEIFWQVITKVTAEGYVYKLDPGLRPEGEKGPLVVSCEGYRKYFEKRASTWEKQALLKARWIAGDKELGRRFIELVHKFIYGERLKPEMVKEIAQMRSRMEQERSGEGNLQRDIKLGYGGIADIEFIIQLLQLKYGSSTKTLRNPQTLRTLAEIVKRGLISPEDGVYLKDSYLFLRNIESCLRMQSENVSNLLPDSEQELNLLSRKIGYNPERGEGNKLLSEYRERTKKIRRIYRKTVSRLS